ncbi:hypothetical protein LXL04_018490 [Taraxacum kok-saghyz]
MATVSSLTRSKGVRRTGGRTKSPFESPSSDSYMNSSAKKGSNQGDSDSDFTGFTSSMHDSTSSATSSIDRYSNGKESRFQRKKPLEKSNSKKRWSFRLSKRNPPWVSLPDDGSATKHHASPVEVSDEPPARKPVLKVTRSGSLRSLKILRSKSKSSSTADNLHSNKATFSSILKDSKFPEQVEPPVGVKESEVNFPVGKLCPYQHCSLHGHHHHNEPPVKRFSFLKRRSSKDQKGVNPKTPATVDKPSNNKTEAKVTKKSSNLASKSKKSVKGVKEGVDCSIEFYSKTISDRESSSGLDDADRANIMFDVNGSNQQEVQNLKIDDDGAKKSDSINGNRMSLWRLIQRHMASELDQQADKEEQSCNVDDDVNQENESRKTFVIKIVREAIQKVLPEVPDHQSNTNSETEHQKLILLRRFLTELEKLKTFDPNKRKFLPFTPESEAETVSLRPQTVREKKTSDDWMLDYALQHVVSELSPTQKRKVALLVKAFESVAPKLNDSEESSFINENGDYTETDKQSINVSDQKRKSSEKEKYTKMWHMVYQHVVADITTKLGSDLLHVGDEEQEQEDIDVNPRASDMLLIKQSINEILFPEVKEDDHIDTKDVDGGELQKDVIPKNWNKLRTLRRSIKKLGSSRKQNLQTQKVDLRRQKSREKTKAEEWMIDYAVQHIVTKLTPARKKRVSMLVEAFEAVIPLPET